MELVIVRGQWRCGGDSETSYIRTNTLNIITDFRDKRFQSLCTPIALRNQLGVQRRLLGFCV